MSDDEAVCVVRRSPGRLRLHAPGLGATGSTVVQRITAAVGVRNVRLNPRTGNILIEFDQALITETKLLTLIGDEPGSARRTRKLATTSNGAEPPADAGWLRAWRAETIRAQPADCIAILLEFERYPQWQTYVTEVNVEGRDKRGRGVSVGTRARAAGREIEFTTSYRFPSPNRIVFEQDDRELGALRGSWAFRSSGGGRTRVTCVLEVKPSWRLSLLLQGSLFERIGEVVLDHLMHELRARIAEQPSYS